MKLYELKNVTELNYPVGLDINQILHYIKEVMECIKDNNLFDGIKGINLWCTGSSGAILSAILADKITNMYPIINIRIQHIKKKNEDSHYSGENRALEKTYYNIVIDDFVATGATMLRIENHLKLHNVVKVDLLILSGINVDYTYEYYSEIGNDILTECNLLHFTPDVLITGKLHQNLHYSKEIKLLSELTTTILC